MKNRLYIYTAFDLYSFIFSILISMWVGHVSSPNLFIFIIFYVGWSTFLYLYWFIRVEETLVPWKRLALPTTILLTASPLLIALSVVVSFWFNNIIFWLIVIPIFVSSASYTLHRLYSIYPSSKK